MIPWHSGLKIGAPITSKSFQNYYLIVADTNLCRLIRFPYPETHYCDSKVEDPTNVDLSRPLPATQFPQSKPIPQPVVRPAPPGSTGWITQKSAPKPVPSRGAWGKGVSTNAHIAPAPGSRRGSSSTTTNKTTASPCKRPLYHYLDVY